MPRALKVCSCSACEAHERSCTELIQSGRCPRCEAAADRRRGTAAERGYTDRWYRFARAFLRKPENAWCSEPRCHALATDVDHIDGLGPKGPRGYDRANLRPYCHPHHSKRTAQDQPGGWNAR